MNAYAKRHLGLSFTLCGTLAWVAPAISQSPEDTKQWELQHAQVLAEQRARAEQLERERAARKADPMAWVRTLDPMTAGGWEFRTVAGDGSWAAFTTLHQMKRSGHVVTVWLRQEFAETQADPNGDHYLSMVQRVEYDCGKDRARPALVIYYSDNNMKGAAQTEQADPKQTPWTPIVPGTLGESDLAWACNADAAHGH